LLFHAHAAIFLKAKSLLKEKAKSYRLPFGEFVSETHEFVPNESV